MSKRKRKAQPAQRVVSQRTTFIGWGIFALIGGIFLFIIGILFIYLGYQPAHPDIQITLPLALSLLTGPLIIEALLILVGLAAIVIGLKK